MLRFAHRFADRTAWDTSESSLSRAIREARAAGREVIDLTVSNPTLCGFSYDSASILAAAANPSALTYDPDPRGIPTARQAVSNYYRSHGAEVDPARVLLTTSTSEAYTFLFRLLADPGDEVLVPQPGYPLFDYLGDLNDLRVRSYPLFYDFGWWIDSAELERRIGPRTRAILVVHPANPTGHLTGHSERVALEQMCARHGIALIVDEVFLDYPVEETAKAAPLASLATGEHPCLKFVVSGLSKIAALPQVKAGWLACFGPDAEVRAALERLEIIADTMLSVSTITQLALPAWLDSRSAMVPQIRARVRENLHMLTRQAIPHLPVQAGWSAILRMAPGAETSAESLVERAGVVVHPGGLYGLAGERFVVVSLLVPPDRFREGTENIKCCFEPFQLPRPAPGSSGG